MKSILRHPGFISIYKDHPIVLVDVGASGGIPRLWQRARGSLRVIGFEPDKRAYEALKSRESDSERFINAALSDKEGAVSLNLTKKQQCSSVLDPNMTFISEFPDEKRYSIVGTAEVRTKPLSKKMFLEEGIDDVDFLKLDTQGQDLNILMGGKELLDSDLFGIGIEVEFAPLYVGQPLFSDVDEFLRKRGFQLFDIRRYYWKRKAGVHAPNVRGQIIFGDALYLKSYESLIDSIRFKTPRDKKIKVLKAVAICQIYNKHDYGVHLTHMATEDGILGADEARMAEQALGKGLGPLPIKGRYLWARIFNKLSLRLTGGEYHCADEELGNE